MRSTTVECLTIGAHPEFGTWGAGQIVTFPKDVADDLIAGGFARLPDASFGDVDGDDKRTADRPPPTRDPGGDKNTETTEAPEKRDREVGAEARRAAKRGEGSDTDAQPARAKRARKAPTKRTRKRAGK